MSPLPDWIPTTVEGVIASFPVCIVLIGRLHGCPGSQALLHNSEIQSAVNKKKKKKRFITALVKTTDLNGEEAIYSPSLPSPSVGGGATELQSP